MSSRLFARRCFLSLTATASTASVLALANRKEFDTSVWRREFRLGVFSSAQCATEPKPSKVTVGYWTIRGLGAPLRMMVMYSGVPLNAVNYDVKEEKPNKWDAACWFVDAKPALLEKNPLINLPYVEVDDEPPVAQTNACLAYLGRKLDLWGDTPLQIVQCEQLLCQCMDLRNEMVKFAYFSEPVALSSLDRPDSRDGHFLSVMASSLNIRSASEKFSAHKYAAKKLLADTKAHFDKFESWLAGPSGGSTTFFVGQKATAPDFHIWEMLDQFEALAKFYGEPSPLATHPRLARFHTEFAALPNNEKYMTSRLHKDMPFNQKMARFASDPSGKMYTRGQAYGWGNTSGTY
eukprot:gb/GEZN01010961.1/.p1 GENE.gb/GEZN01010961.1/~~gb/GEZN01010961.1/.p1  ORF type:complete len:349 (-),score=35.51 gb/GEZN01010961.1/:107-1153(-)